ncbi:MAG: hypothetical protein MUF64_24685 [Polyangiaceae bacterium]|nr:hypothetical protein [Polyangiaceae bacterium]
MRPLFSPQVPPRSGRQTARLGALLSSLALVLALTPSCSEDPPLPVPEVDEPLFLEEFSQEICKRRVNCNCADAAGLPSQQGCVEAVQARLKERFRLGDSSLRFDGNCAALFLQDFSSTVGCDVDVPALLQRTRCSLGCSLVSGEIAEAQSCSADPTALVSACSSGLRCEGDPGACAAACPAPDPAPGLDQPCAAGRCGDGLQCQAGVCSGPAARSCLFP